MGVFRRVGDTRVGCCCLFFLYTELFLLFSSNWEEASCVLLKTEILEEWVDCRGVSTVPCLEVKVNFTDTNQTAFLHVDEELVLYALEVGN